MSTVWREISIRCPFCNCTLHSQGRHPNEVAQSLATHLRYFHPPPLGEEE